MENFFGHLKSEMYFGEQFASVDHFMSELDDHSGWYNTQRVQERLEGMTPMEYRNHGLENHAAQKRITESNFGRQFNDWRHMIMPKNWTGTSSILPDI